VGRKSSGLDDAVSLLEETLEEEEATDEALTEIAKMRSIRKLKQLN
jgi:ferritin-like metal-binding protein YciE